MHFSLWYGGAGSGKTRRVLEAVRENRERGQRAVLLVPEHQSKTYEDMLLRWFGGALSQQAEVLSFQRLATRVLADTGGAGKPYIDACGKSILMAKTLAKLKKRLPVLGRSRFSGGYAKAMADAVAELKRYGVSAQALDVAARALPEDGLLKRKLFDLAAVYARFDEEVSARHADRDDDLARLADALPGYDGLSDVFLYIDGFYGFTKMEQDILFTLLRKVKEAVLCLPLERLSGKEGLFSPVYKTYRRLCARLSQVGEGFCEQVCCVEESGKSPGLSHLRRYIYRYPTKPYDGQPDDIRIFSVPDAYAEAEGCAARILQLCEDRGARLRDMVVLVSNMEQYGRMTADVLRSCGIPCFLDAQEDILSHPLIVLCLCALECVRKNYPYDAVFRTIKTGFFGADASAVDRLENYVLLRGIQWNDYKRDTKWQLTPEQEERFPDLLQTRDLCVGPLLALEQALKADRSAVGYCRALYGFLQRIGAYETLQNRIVRLKDEGDLYKAAQYARIWNLLLQTLDQTALSLGDEPLGLAPFCQIFESALSLYEIKIVPQTLDEVLITTKDRLPGSRRDYLFFLGVCDGLVPTPASAEGILKDADRTALAQLGIELSGGAQDKAFDEQFLLYRVLSMPEKGLYLSFPRADADGAPVHESMLIRLLRNLFPALPIRTQDEQPVSYLPARGPALRRLLQSDAFRQTSGAPEGLDGVLLTLFEHDGKTAPLVRTARRALYYDNRPKPLLQGSVARWFGDPAQFSVSQLERYASCRFSYFLQYLLGAKERPEFEVSAVDLGILIHAALEEFSRRVVQAGRDFSDLSASDVDRMLDEVFASVALQQVEALEASKRTQHIKKRLFQILRRCILLLGEQFRRSDFRPVGYELSFAKDGYFPPIELALKGAGRATIRGKIDRADLCEDPETGQMYVRVVDYKSGAKSLLLSDVYDGLSLQLLTYLKAAADSLSKRLLRPVVPSGGLYFRIFEPQVTAKARLTPAEAEALLRREMRMTGLVLKDERVVRLMDHAIDGVSDIIPAALAKDGSVRAAATTADEAQLRRVMDFVGRKSADLAGDILSGDIAIDPYQKSGKTGCDFCPYRAVCAFDPDYNHYRQLGLYTHVPGEGGSAHAD